MNEPAVATPHVEPQPGWRDRVTAVAKRIWTFPVIVFVTTRITYMLFSLMSLELIPTLFYHEERRQMFLKPYPFLDGLCRWDCGWFVTIIERGYDTLEHAKVFPLYAVLGGAIERLTGLHHLLAFLLISNVAALIAYVIIFNLFKQLADEAAARWGLILFVSFPFAYYQAAAYPESLMILASAASVSLALKGRHISAGFAVGLGMMARHLTLFAGAGLVVAQIRQRGIHPRKLLLHPGILGLLIPWLFLGAFSIYLNHKVGDPLAFWTSRTIGWNEWVWYGARQILLYVPYHERPEYFYYIGFALIPLAGAVALLRKKEWAELAANGLVLMIVIMSSGAAGMGRYSASCWPAFLPLGLWLSKRPMLQGPSIAVMAIFQGLFFFLYTHQFRIL